MLLTLFVFLTFYILSHTIWKKWIERSILFCQANLLFASVITIGVMLVLNTIIYFARYDEEKLYDGVDIVRYDEDDNIKLNENILQTEDRGFYLKNIKTEYVTTDTINGFAVDAIYKKAVDYNNQWFILNGTLDRLDRIILYNAPQQ